MGNAIANAQVMPLYASLPISLIYVVLLFLTMNRTPSRAVRFLIFAISVRFLIDVFYTVAYKSSPLGISWNALCTLFVTGVGLLIVRKRPISDPIIIAILPLMAIVAISGVANGEVIDMVGVLAKYGYFTVLALAIVDGLEDVSSDDLLKPLMAALSIPFVFQVVSVPLGVVKANEADGSASYIGGFAHEAGFSVALAGGLLALALIRRMHPATRTILLGWCGVALLLANYRTTILSLAVLIGVIVMVGVTRRFLPRQRPFVLGMMIIAVAMVGTFGLLQDADRYADVGTTLSKGSEIIKDPKDFSIEDRKLLSGRSLIWSRYIYAYKDGTPVQKMVGFGAETWDGRFRTYAHNTLVSTLYELGVFGIVAVLFLWTRMTMLALRITGPERPIILAAHASFLIMAMATMPMWMIEGLIFYGILCGYTAFAVNRAGGEHRSRAHRPSSADTRSAALTS